jgi:hypothetical protein
MKKVGGRSLPVEFERSHDQAVFPEHDDTQGLNDSEKILVGYDDEDERKARILCFGRLLRITHPGHSS